MPIFKEYAGKAPSEIDRDAKVYNFNKTIPVVLSVKDLAKLNVFLKDFPDDIKEITIEKGIKGKTPQTIMSFRADENDPEGLLEISKFDEEGNFINSNLVSFMSIDQFFPPVVKFKDESEGKLTAERFSLNVIRRFIKCAMGSILSVNTTDFASSSSPGNISNVRSNPPRQRNTSPRTSPRSSVRNTGRRVNSRAEESPAGEESSSAGKREVCDLFSKEAE